MIIDERRMGDKVPAFIFSDFVYNTDMLKLGVEQMRFSSHVGTEPRFAFRRWFETWVEAVNVGNREVWQPAVLESIAVVDIVDRELDHTGFIGYLTNSPKRLYIPRVVIGLEDGLYVIKGTMEVYADTMMVFEGGFEMTVHDIGAFDFKIFSLTCYPHFRVSV